VAEQLGIVRVPDVPVTLTSAYKFTGNGQITVIHVCSKQANDGWVTVRRVNGSSATYILNQKFVAAHEPYPYTVPLNAVNNDEFFVQASDASAYDIEFHIFTGLE
jgi:hypothetical protein